MPKKTERDEMDKILDSELVLALKIDKKAAAKLGRQEISYLVEQYYAMQHVRIQCGNRAAGVAEQGEPSALLRILADRMEELEARLRGIFKAWCSTRPVSEWAMSVYGIGPVLAAALEAHIDIRKASSPSAVWRFAGLDPTSEWLGKEKGAKAVTEALAQTGGNLLAAATIVARRIGMREDTLVRLATTNADGEAIDMTKSSLSKAAAIRPYNDRLKVVCWKIGESFKKQSGRKESLYGKLYRQRKLLEVERNDAGRFKELAEQTLRDRNFGASQTRDAYESGKLPDGRLDLRATRYATKMFLSHWWECAWRVANPGKEPPAPWAIAHGGHVDKVAPENPYPV